MISARFLAQIIDLDNFLNRLQNLSMVITLGATGAENLPGGCEQGRDEPRARHYQHRPQHQHGLERVPQRGPGQCNGQ